MIDVAVTTDIPKTVEHKKGVSRYTESIVRAMQQSSSINVREYPRTGSFAEKFISGYLDRKHLGDVIHVTAPRVYYWPLVTAAVPTVMTVHGLDFYFPQRFRAPVTDVKAFLYQNLVTHVARRADEYIVSTKFFADELVVNTGVKRDHVNVIPFGIDPAFRSDDIDPVDGDYLLTDTPTREVLEVFREVLAQGIETNLVIVGKRGYGLSPILGNASPDELKRIISVGFVDTETLAEYYAGARALIHWSDYETFGFPPVEAMATGTPPVVNASASLPEVVGSGGFVCKDLGEMAEAVIEIAERDDAQLAQNARIWSARYSWDRSAIQTIELYEEMAR